MKNFVMVKKYWAIAIAFSIALFLLFFAKTTAATNASASASATTLTSAPPAPPAKGGGDLAVDHRPENQTHPKMDKELCQKVGAWFYTPVDPAQCAQQGGFGDELMVRVEQTPIDCASSKSYQLRLNDIDTGIHNISCESSGTLGFLLSRHGDGAQNNTQSPDPWPLILEHPLAGAKRQVSMSVSQTGEDGKISILPLTKSMQSFEVWRPDWSAAAFVSVAAIVLLVIAVARKNQAGLLRDSGTFFSPQPSNAKKPYSLARCQMAWWSVIIFLSYVYLWCVTHELPQLTNSALLLLGFSTGSGYFARLIDNGKQSQLNPSEGLINDLTTDADGVTIYRLQYLVWTVFFGLQFIVDVINTLAIPSYDQTMLSLMGISAGAYLGFKKPEVPAKEGASTGGAGTDVVSADSAKLNGYSEERT